MTTPARYRCLYDGCTTLVGPKQYWCCREHRPVWARDMPAANPADCQHTAWWSGLLVLAMDAPELYEQVAANVPEGCVVEVCKGCHKVRHKPVDGLNIKILRRAA